MVVSVWGFRKAKAKESSLGAVCSAWDLALKTGMLMT
jgi:hypothetical protein